MKQKELSQLTDQELLDAAKKVKNTTIINAVLIGFLVGVVLYSVVNNTWGLLMLIPLFFAYKLINSSKRDATELEDLLRKRKLK